MKNGILWVVASLMAAIGLVACGGGGGGGAAEPATPIGTPVDLSQIKNYAEARTPGSSLSFNLAGSNSIGAKLSGIFAFSISAPTVTSTPTGTQTINVFVQNVSLTNTSTGASSSGTSTWYYYQTGNLYKIVLDDGTVSIPTSQTLLPASAKVGDSGNDMVLSSSDGTTESSTWRIDPGINGDGKFVYSFTSRDNLNVVTFTSEDSYTIKPDGSISAFATKIIDSSTGVTATLSGNKN